MMLKAVRIAAENAAIAASLLALLIPGVEPVDQHIQGIYEQVSQSAEEDTHGCGGSTHLPPPSWLSRPLARLDVRLGLWLPSL
jgi:hypothetical protein